MSDTAASLTLSDLPPVADFLAERGARNEELLEGLDDITDYDQGAALMVQLLVATLDEWLEYANWRRHQADPFTEPFQYLAASDHIDVVQRFRDVLQVA